MTSEVTEEYELCLGECIVQEVMLCYHSHVRSEGLNNNRGKGSVCMWVDAHIANVIHCSL